MKKLIKMIRETDKKDRKYDIILHIKLNSTSASSVLRQISDWIDEKRRFLIVTPNPEIIMLAQNDAVLSGILNCADISLPDGVGLVWASRWKVFCSHVPFIEKINSPSAKSGTRPRTSAATMRRLQSLGLGSNISSSKMFQARNNLLKERVSGTDVMERLIELAARHGWRVFLLGGRSEVANEAVRRIKEKFIIHNSKFIIQSYSGPWLDNNGKPVNKIEIEKEKRVIEKINKFQPHLLFVGFGAPKQEKWVAVNYNKIQTCGTMVVGGAFDYTSGRVPRAPEWMRTMGFEWLFRLIVEPWRVKRQLALIKFIWAVLTSKT